MDSKAIIGAVQGVTSKWTKQRKAEERNKRAYARRGDRLGSHSADKQTWVGASKRPAGVAVTGRAWSSGRGGQVGTLVAP